jgi:hypothetical protein
MADRAARGRTSETALDERDEPANALRASEAGDPGGERRQVVSVGVGPDVEQAQRPAALDANAPKRGRSSAGGHVDERPTPLTAVASPSCARLVSLVLYEYVPTRLPAT